MWFVLLIVIIVVVVWAYKGTLANKLQYKAYQKILSALKEEGFKISERPNGNKYIIADIEEVGGQIVGKIMVSRETTLAQYFANDDIKKANAKLGSIANEFIDSAHHYYGSLAYWSLLPPNLTTSEIEKYLETNPENKCVKTKAWMKGSVDATHIVFGIMDKL